MKIKNCWCGGTAKRGPAVKSGLSAFVKYKQCQECGSYYQSTDIDKIKIDKQYQEELPNRTAAGFQVELQKAVELYWSKLDQYAWPLMSKNEPKTLLDIGCSTGTFLMHAKKYGLNFTLFGIDTNQKAILKAREIGNFQNLDFTSLRESQFLDNYFDIIVCHDVIEHFEEPLNELKEMYRILKPGGVIQITTPNAFGKDLTRWDMARPDHYWLFSERAIIKMSLEAGFNARHIAVEDISKFSYDNSIMVVLKK